MRLLILVPGDVGENMSGPAIRAWLLARALSKQHEVTAAIEGRMPEQPADGIRTIPSTRVGVARELMRSDAVLAACLQPYLLLIAQAAGVMSISDHYDPVELELGTIEGAQRRLRRSRVIRSLQQAHSDVVLCAGVAQRRVALAELEQLGRIDGTGPIVGVVPFGIPSAPSRTEASPLRDRFPEIRSTDKIVLWWGKIWSWFDAATAVEAFVPLAERRPDIKLVLTAGPAPDPSTEAYSREGRARQLAERHGLLGRNVFFLEDWIPYEHRHECLHEADLGLTLHANTAEAEVAARSRLMDYLWTGLPSVLTEGDEISAQFAARGFAQLVRAGDPVAVTESITRILDAPDALAQARRAGETLAEHYRWDTIAQGLTDIVGRSDGNRQRPRRLFDLATGAARYYWRRAIDVLADIDGLEHLRWRGRRLLAHQKL